MGQIITVYGSPGSGKTTTAVNLACAFADLDKVVILIAANLNHAAIQTFFGDKIEKENGIFAALVDQTEQPEKFLTQTSEFENIYILAPPNETYEVHEGPLEENVVHTIFRKLSITADYVIVDAASDLSSGLTLMGLRWAQIVICMHRSTITNSLWAQSVRPIVLQLTDGAMLDIVSEHDAGCAVHEYIKTTQIENALTLPNVMDAVYYETIGKPLYRQSGKQHLSFNKTISAVAELIVKEEL